MAKSTERTKRIAISILIALLAALQGGNFIDAIKSVAIAASERDAIAIDK